MKAIRVRDFGGPDVLQLTNIPDPDPGPGEVVVRLMAAGVNPVESYIRSGNYGRLPELPYTPGSDGAGMIFSVGSGVPPHIQAGQRVWLGGSASGTYAEATVCDALQVFHLPDRVSFAQGAAVGIPYTTAYRALFQRGGGKPGEAVLVHGATGGVGVAVVQFAVAAGLRVFATGGSEPGRRMLRDQGVTDIFDHTAPAYPDAVLQATGGKGVDLIIEMLANVNLVKDLAMLARFGRVVVVGSRGSVDLNPREAMVRDADIRGVMVLNTPAPELRECRAAISAGLESGVLVPQVWQEFGLEDTSRAHEAMMAPGHRGKIVLRCGEPR